MATGKAQVEGAWRAARHRWRALGGGKAQVEGAVRAARRRWRVVCGCKVKMEGALGVGALCGLKLCLV